MTAFVVQGDLRLTGAQAVRGQITATADETRKLKTAAAELGTGARTGAQGLQQLGREADSAGESARLAAERLEQMYREADQAAEKLREAAAAGALAAAQNDVLAGSTSRSNAALTNFGFQVQDTIVQMAGGTSAARALGQQLPQLLSGFGLIGVVAGTAAAALVPMAGYFFDIGEAAAEVDAINLSGVRGAISDLSRLQAEYNNLIRQTALAQTEQGRSAIDSLGREIEAKAALFRLEIETARIRKSQLEAEIAAERQKFEERAAGLSLVDDPDRDIAGFVGQTQQAAALRDQFNQLVEASASFFQTLRRNNAELELINITIEQGEAAIAEATSATGDWVTASGGVLGALEGNSAVIAGVAGWIASAADATSDLAGGVFESAEAGRALNTEGFQINGWLGGAIGLAANFAAQMWDAAAATSASVFSGARNYDRELATTGQSSGPDSARSKLFGGGAFRAPVLGAGLATPQAAGGGGAAARDETAAIDRLIERRQQELALLQETDPVQREMIRQRELLADATDAQRSKVIELTVALEKEKALQESTQFFADSASGTLAEILRSADSAGEAIDRLKDKLIDAGIEALLLGRGPLAGLFGISGSIFSDIFRPRGGGFLSGLFGGGRADGGPIYGRGGPRDDQVLIAASPGEYMVNARATARHRGLLEFINGGGDIGRFATGGAVGGGSDGAAGIVPGGIHIPISVDARGATDGVATQIAAALRAATPEIVQAAVAAVSRERIRGRMA